jgi:hypothetical protein
MTQTPSIAPSIGLLPSPHTPRAIEAPSRAHSLTVLRPAALALRSVEPLTIGHSHDR